MTNEEKKEYLSLKLACQSTPFIDELKKLDDYISKTPKVLYKYRKFDNYTIDMIENDYIYIAPANSLDDPFDCLTNVDIENIFDKDSSNLKDEMIEFIADIILSHCDPKKAKKEQIIFMINESTVNGQIDKEILERILKQDTSFTNEEKHIFLNSMSNFSNTVDTIVNDDAMKNLFVTLMHSKEKIGLCSLTTKRDNKPMWSLYADTYKGYCIEYETPVNKESLYNLYPVIYTKEFDNDIVKFMIKFALETIIRFATNGQIKTEMGCFSELTCTKDSDWEYQDEWRFVSDAGSKVKTFKIKSIYLGFDVSKENEQKIIDLAYKKNFKVYKMNEPKGFKTITYKMVCSPEK